MVMSRACLHSWRLQHVTFGLLHNDCMPVAEWQKVCVGGSSTELVRVKFLAPYPACGNAADEAESATAGLSMVAGRIINIEGR